MARLQKIVRSNPISNFQQVAPEGGTAFRLLADAMSVAYDRVAPYATEVMSNQGMLDNREKARRDFAGVSVPYADDALSALRKFEGFRDTPYWDVNAHRVGYGSDTITDPDGTVRRVKPGDRVTRQDAERDLVRRVTTEFLPAAAAAIGPAFHGFTMAQKAAVASIAYNYGSIPKRILGALQSGDAKAAAEAIRALGSDNGGVNAGRRAAEAGMFLGGGGSDTVAGGAAGDTLAPVSVQTKDGRVEYRRYSPYSGPILQAYDAAAKVAYQAEAMNKGAADLLQLSHQYETDPDGFMQAAQSYVDQLVAAAPTDLRGDILNTMTTAAQRRALGIMEQRHQETRARADNASRALIDRWSDAYAEALASGNKDEIAAAASNLDGILKARESLPGLSWTPQQSDNVVRKAQENATRLTQQRQKERSSEYKSAFNLVIAAAKKGMQAEGEDVLQNPEAVAMHPELAREAAAFASLRDNAPEFLKMTPDQADAYIAQMAGKPIGEAWEIDVIDAARGMAKENRKAWEDDPVLRASEVLASSQMGPPPEIPELTPEDPSKFVDALADRREYMRRVVASGYTDTLAFLSKDEAEQIATAMGNGTDPAIRAAVSGAIVSGFGQDAIKVFDEIGGDRVTMFAGKMQAIGGRPDVAAAMLQGQMMLAENLVQIPAKSDRLAAFDGEVASAFQGVSGGVEAQAEVMEAAKALYASQAQGIQPDSDAASELMAQSIQTALGQTKNKRGDLIGGVQTVSGHPTLLPPDLNGDDVDVKMRAALGELVYKPGFFGGHMTAPADAWTKAGANSVPLFNGIPLPSSFSSEDKVRAVPVGGNIYRLEIVTGATRVNAEDANGNVFFFDMKKLVEAFP